MIPYGGGCKCCKGMSYGDDHHKRTSQRMAAAREMAREVNEHLEHLALQRWREHCESITLTRLLDLTFCTHFERQEIAQEILERRLQDEDEL